MDNGFNGKEKEQYRYRGMPYSEDGIYASARNIGNWGSVILLEYHVCLGV